MATSELPRIFGSSSSLSDPSSNPSDPFNGYPLGKIVRDVKDCNTYYWRRYPYVICVITGLNTDDERCESQIYSISGHFQRTVCTSPDSVAIFKRAIAAQVKKPSLNTVNNNPYANFNKEPFDILWLAEKLGFDVEKDVRSERSHRNGEYDITFYSIRIANSVASILKSKGVNFFIHGCIVKLKPNANLDTLLYS